jgi:ABC-type Mn2+/Zn2+ transport system ATPase subunit
MQPAAYERLVELLGQSSLEEPVVSAVLAAAESAAALKALLAGEARPETPVPVPVDAPALKRVYLHEIQVEGFRGIGDCVRLQFEPCPGLTLIGGRNGSGKSSFAEAFELLLTDTTLRWEERTKIWREGWRNLHHDGPTEISASFYLDGEPQPLTLSRRWSPGATLDAADPLIVTGARSAWTELGWGRPLEQFRPVLSYTELGTMFSARAAVLYEALSAVLGLEDFDGVMAVLRQERLERDKTAKEEKQVRSDAVGLLSSSEDLRAAHFADLLSRRSPDVVAVSALLQPAERDEPLVDTHDLETLSIPTREQVTTALADVEEEREKVSQLESADIDQGDALAHLLESGLAFYRIQVDEPSSDCPFCGTADVIDADWAARAEAAATELRARSRELRDARAALHHAIKGVQSLFSPQTPAILDRASLAGIDTSAARSTWTSFAEISAGDTAELVQRGAPVARRLASELEDARAAATAAHDEHTGRWQPVQAVLLDWVAVARRAERDRQLVALLKTAEAWMGQALVELRKERLAPVVQGAQQNWDELRCESDIVLDDLALRKQGNLRFAAFDVSIDGVEASAYGVMSQGELSGLAISVFLPRAMLPGSPFGFMVIDDPVQSMDPVRVAGLARVLARAARERQVIVFTQDEQLPAAVRMLDIDARIANVRRRPPSKVEVVALKSSSGALDANGP